MEEVDESKEVDGLTAPSTSSTGALQRGGGNCASTGCTARPLLAALWSSVNLSTESQATSTGVFGELWIPGLKLSVCMRPSGIP